LFRNKLEKVNLQNEWPFCLQVNDDLKFNEIVLKGTLEQNYTEPNQLNQANQSSQAKTNYKKPNKDKLYQISPN
jgi:hypothetical protein